MPGKVKVLSGALDDQDGEIVLRGIIDAASLKHLQIPDYQREVLSEKKIQQLMEVHRTGRVADVDLNMRGQRVDEYDDGSFILSDPVYMVDGLQRITAGIRVMNDDPPVVPRIGATIYIGKDEAWERKRFEALNLDRTKLSPNVHLRNLKDETPALQALFRLTHDASFVLRGKVQWGQASRKGELISATTYVKALGRLHAHLGPGRGSDVRAIARGIDTIMDVIGRPTLVANAKAFFGLIDECWGIANVEFREGATQLKANFLATLADVLSEHEDFWTEDQHGLVVPASIGVKLARFKVQDPLIVQLASSGGMSQSYLFDRLVDHLDSGKRTNKLRRRGRVAPGS